MSSVGIFPAPGYTEGYIELARSPTGRVFTKHILTIGRPFVHPKTGKPLTVDEAWFTRMKRNFDDGVSIVQVPLVNDRNEHPAAGHEDPLRNAGEVIGLERDGDKVLAVLDIRDPDVADKIASKTILGASAMMHMDYKDSASGVRRGPALLHCAITNRPHLVDLDDYQEVVAASAEAYDELPDGSIWPPQVLMLCASEADVPVVMLADPGEGDYEHDDQHEYDYGGSMSQDDVWRDEIGRLSLAAMAVSDQGVRRRGTRPSYSGVITEHDRDRHAALAAEISDELILAAQRELASQYRVSSDSVLCLVHDTHQRSGLGFSAGERAQVIGAVQVALSRGDLYVSDEAILGLTRACDREDEILRLTSEPELEDIFGLAHPQKSGKLVTTKGKHGRAHSPDEEDAATEDPDAAVARYLEMHAGMFGAEAPHAGSHGSTSYPSKSPARREREQRRAEGGKGGRGGRPIPDLHPAHAPAITSPVQLRLKAGLVTDDPVPGPALLLRVPE